MTKPEGVKKLKKLFEPIKIGPYTLKNRIVKGPTGSNLAFVSGEPSPEQLFFYEETARGGVAMVVTELVEIDSRYMSPPPHLRIDSDIFVAGLQKLVEVIHLNGSLVSMQLHHAGYMSASDHVAPSNIPVMVRGKLVQPRPMADQEIEDARNRFIAAAARAKLVGSEMVELHGGRNYLLHEFVSPHTNRRSDKWGGTFENRIRLPVEIIQGIHETCGPDFPIGYRMVADEFVPDGMNLEQAIAFAKRLEQEGVAYLSIQLIPAEFMKFKEGVFAMRSPKDMANKYTAALRKEVSIPVFGGQQIHEPELMEEILENKVADVLCLARPLLCDPQLPRKALEGRFDDIRMCIKCGHCFDCIDSTFEKLSCTLNPALGKGREWDIRPTHSPKRVLVVGGGAAGLEAARIAALRGHDVTLVEKEVQLGGQTLIAALPVGKQHLKSYVIDWLERQYRKAGVKIQLNKQVTPEVIEEINPEAVIVATGATPLIPSIPGVTKSHVVHAWDVLRGAQLGKSVVVAGGGQVGVETADFIAEKALAESVTIVEMLPEIATDMDIMNRAYIIQKLYEYKVKILTEMKVEEITDKGLVAIDKERKRHTIEADTVVLALGAVPNENPAEALKSKVPELHIIGDCVKPRKLIDAIREGAYVSRQI